MIDKFFVARPSKILSLIKMSPDTCKYTNAIEH